jgi:hypothetical protein
MYSIPTDNNSNTTPAKMEYSVDNGMTEFYLVGTFCNPQWSQIDGEGRIAFTENEDGTFETTATLEAGDEFKIITPADDGGWDWFGGAHEYTDYFLVTPDFYNNLIPISLQLNDPEEKGNFKMEYGPATYKITLKEAPEQPSGIAPKGLKAPLVMVMEKTTGINTINNAKKVVEVKYVNVAGMESSTPFKGMNIVVTRYDDGSQTSTKVIK